MASLDDLMRLGDPDEIRVTIKRLRAENERLTAECEALRADVVWAVENGARLLQLHKEDGTKEVRSLNWSAKYLACDGTDADIWRAVREARKQ